MDLENISIAINKFPGLIHNMLNEGLTFPLYTSEKSRNWRRHHIPYLEKYVNQIKINIYHDSSFRILNFRRQNYKYSS